MLARVFFRLAALAVVLHALLASPEQTVPASADSGSRLNLNADFVRSPTPLLWRFIDAVLGVGPFPSLFALESENIIAHARRKGCAKFASDQGYWRRALDALTHSIAVDKPAISNTGRFMLFEQLSNNLCIQHAVSNLLETHGANITSQRIVRPVIIAGPPRTGSTFLLSLLSRHPNATAVTYLEAVEPVAPWFVPTRLLCTPLDPRYYKIVFATSLVHWLLPSFSSLFGNLNFDGPFEEMQLGAVVFGSTLFVAEMVLPTYSTWLLTHDQTPMEVYTKLLLQVIQFQRGGPARTWILKSPQNSEMLYAKAAVFPDAVHVFTQRNLSEIIESLVAMLAYTSKVFNRNDQDLRALAMLWLKRLKVTGEQLTQDYVDRHVSRDRQLFVTFADLVREPMEHAATIFAAAGLPFGAAERARLELYLASNVRQGSVKFRYDVKSFGVSQTEIDQAVGRRTV